MGSLLRNSTYWNRQTIVQVRGATPAAYVPGRNPLPVVEPCLRILLFHQSYTSSKRTHYWKVRRIPLPGVLQVPLLFNLLIGWGGLWSSPLKGPYQSSPLKGPYQSSLLTHPLSEVHLNGRAFDSSLLFDAQVRHGLMKARSKRAANSLVLFRLLLFGM